MTNQIRNSKLERPTLFFRFEFRALNFEFDSSFEFRISSFILCAVQIQFPISFHRQNGVGSISPTAILSMRRAASWARSTRLSGIMYSLGV